MGGLPAAIVHGRVTMLILRTLYFEDLSVGMTERLSKTVASSDVVGFAEVTGDRNPIHLSEHFAAKTSFRTRIRARNPMRMARKFCPATSPF